MVLALALALVLALVSMRRWLLRCRLSLTPRCHADCPPHQLPHPLYPRNRPQPIPPAPRTHLARGSTGATSGAIRFDSVRGYSDDGRTTEGRPAVVSAHARFDHSRTLSLTLSTAALVVQPFQKRAPPLRGGVPREGGVSLKGPFARSAGMVPSKMCHALMPDLEPVILFAPVFFLAFFFGG